MKFNEFFNKEQILKNKLISEMSLRNDDDQINFDLLNNLFQNRELCKKIRQNGEFLSKETIRYIPNIEVWNFPTNAVYGLNFILNDKILATVDFNAIQDGNAIQIVFINVFKQYSGLLQHIFIDYLLNVVDSIYSDNIQTTLAFYFYRSLNKKKHYFSNNFEMFLVNIITNEETLIKKDEDMLVTFGDDVEHFHIKYKIQKI